jgi:hypothetical protein
MIRLSGRMTPFVIASRSSATFFPEKSRLRAAEAADPPVLRAAFCACCWRPRALPPALAARLRAALLREDDDEPERELDEERRLLEELELPELELRDPELRELELRELDAREPEPRELELARRPPEPDDLRDDDPPEDFLRDEPLPLLPLDSAIAILLRSLVHAGCAPHYMPTAAVT